jgi:hypothetical protein
MNTIIIATFYNLRLDTCECTIKKKNFINRMSKYIYKYLIYKFNLHSIKFNINYTFKKLFNTFYF